MCSRSTAVKAPRRRNGPSMRRGSPYDRSSSTHRGRDGSQDQEVAEPETNAELEAALARALVGLKAATAARRRLPPRSPDLVDAIRIERDAMERIERLIVRLPRDGP